MLPLTIDWLKFLVGLALLVTPGDWFSGGKTRYRDISRDWSGHWTRILTHGTHAIDFARAALGTWLLLDSLHPLPNARGFAKYAVLCTQGSIRVFAVFIQMMVCRQKDSLNAPFAFVAGLLLTGSSPISAAFSLAFAITVAAGSNTPIAFFPVLGLTHLAIGFWFKGKGAVASLSFGAFAAMLPMLWSLAFRRDLVITYRAKRQAEEDSHSPLR